MGLIQVEPLKTVEMKVGRSSIAMLEVPPFELQEIHPELGEGLHPAFIDGPFYVAAKQLGNMKTFDQAADKCAGLGAGWGLLSNDQWAALALLCWRRRSNFKQLGLESGRGEWVSGLRLMDGEIQVETASHWKGLGRYVNAAWAPFSLAEAESEHQVELMQRALIPLAGDFSGWFFRNEQGERLPIRGGDWYHGAYAGVFYLYLDYTRGNASSNIGFRPAFRNL
jgi:hypothetical protein